VDENIGIMCSKELC